jgi:hypothetical protein
MTQRLTRLAIQLINAAGLQVLAIEDRAVLASSSGAKLAKAGAAAATVL